ncbi:MAG: hypothetical protein GXY15_07240 [Candidatus Hydrogenedentes bacterium]|nr:hypothetical protein [Candidatus Hydrogenedentota bacterium]
MSLESIETRCLNYLRQAANPLVPVRTLLAHCLREEPASGITEQALLGFLRAHGEVIVLEGPGAEDLPGGAVEGAAAVAGPRALLKARKPDPGAVLLLLREQMDMVRAVLDRMAPEADQETDPVRRAAFDTLKARAEELAEKIGLLE